MYGAGIVGADHQHDGLRLESLAFAILQAPENSLRRVAGDGEVGRLNIAEILVENRLVGVSLHPPVGDRVAVKQEIDMAFARGLREAQVPGPHPLLGLRISGRDIHARRLEHQLRFELLKQRFGLRVV